MKRLAWTLLLIMALTAGMAACGGGGSETPAEPVTENTVDGDTAAETTGEEPAEPTAEEANNEAAEDAAAESTAPEAAAEDSATDAPAEAPADAEPAGGDMIGGLPASGTDPDTGLEINPPSVVPGVDFIVRGEIVNANLTPQDSPEFVVLAPSGTRYRIRSQPVSEIAYSDGVKPALHEFQRGVLLQATVRQEEDAGATITVNSVDLTLLHDE